MKTMNRMTGLALATLLGAAVTLEAAPAKPAAAKSPAQEALADIEKTFGFVPQLFRDFPESVLPGTWVEMKSLQMNPNTVLNGKVKELIGLGVAAQIPCTYCIDAHIEFAKLNGATEAEIGEAVSVAALTRHWSTFINGIQTDEKQFRADIGKAIDHIKKSMDPNAPPAKSAEIAVVDGASANKDIAQVFGFVPDFLKKFPEQSRAAAWNTLKAVELAPGALPGKHKSLVAIAVASQVPCKFCLIADTEFARLDGATEAEINEAIAMAAFTRQMSTLLNGMQVDLTQFRADVSRLVKGAQAAAAKDKKAAKVH